MTSYQEFDQEKNKQKFSRGKQKAKWGGRKKREGMGILLPVMSIEFFNNIVGGCLVFGVIDIA